MKWYSVKKYRPQKENGMHLLVDVDGDYYLGIYTYEGSRDYEWRWVDEKNKVLHSITHFCVPLPIELDE